MFAKQRESMVETFHSIFTLCDKRQKEFLGNNPESTMIAISKNELKPHSDYLKYIVDCGADRRTFYGRFDSPIHTNWFNATENCNFSPVDGNGNYYMRVFYPDACMVRAYRVHTGGDGKIVE